MDKNYRVTNTEWHIIFCIMGLVMLYSIGRPTTACVSVELGEHHEKLVACGDIVTYSIGKQHKKES